jgi:modulator of FtsH protease HflC
MLRVKILLLILVLVFTYFSTYIIHEGQRGLVLRFGLLQQDATSKRPIVLQPGIHFKLPFLYHVVKVDMRSKTTNLTSAPITTAKQEYMQIDYYVNWRVVDLKQYFATGPKADRDLIASLQALIDEALQEHFSKLDLVTLVEKVNHDSNLWLLKNLQQNATNLGLDIEKIGFTKISFAKESQAAIFERARAQYNDLLNKQRGELGEQMQNIKRQADAEAEGILNIARAKVAQVNAVTTAAVADIYAPAYALDPDFFIWQHSLNLYKKSFSGGDNIVLMKAEDGLLQHLEKK